MTNRRPLMLFILILTVVLLAACSAPAAPTVNQPTTTASTEIAEATTQATVPPTEPAPTERIILVNNSGTDSSAVESVLRELSGGLEVTTQPGLEPSELDGGVKAVIFMTPPANLDALVAGAPQVQFLAFSGQDLTVAPNLSVIKDEPVNRAFAAGVLAAMLSPDWRVGGLLPAEAADQANAFSKGTHYLCGRCVPVLGPVVTFPVIGTAPNGSPSSSWQAAYDTIAVNRIETLYVSAEAASPELLTNLAAQQIVLIGSQTPPDAVRSAWAATLQTDLLTPLRSLLPQMLAGTGGQVISTSLTLTDVDTNRISSGKMAMLEQVISDLSNGLLDPYDMPAETPAE